MDQTPDYDPGNRSWGYKGWTFFVEKGQYYIHGPNSTGRRIVSSYDRAIEFIDQQTGRNPKVHAMTKNFIVERNESGQLVATERGGKGRELVLVPSQTLAVVEAWYTSDDRDRLAPMANLYLHNALNRQR